MEMKRLAIFFLFCVFSLGATASVKQAADSAYLSADYKMAQKLYGEVLREGVNADVYYNLGNAEYRLGNLPRAILNYRRALSIEPAYEAAKKNIELCEAKLRIATERPDEMFFFTFYRDFKQGQSCNTWTAWSLCFLALALLFAAIYVCARRVSLRKVAFTLALIGFVCFLLTSVYAWQAKQRYQNERSCVVMSTARLQQSPTEDSAEQGELQPGTTLRILSEEAGWYCVLLPGGQEVWIKQTDVEVL